MGQLREKKNGESKYEARRNLGRMSPASGGMSGKRFPFSIFSGGAEKAAIRTGEYTTEKTEEFPWDPAGE